MKNKDTFFETFAGEFVEIVQDFEVTTNLNIVDDRVQEMRMPMTVSGFVMDSDGEFLYLSPEGEEINQALPIHTIKHICIVPVANPLQEMLDIVEPPEGKDFN